MYFEVSHPADYQVGLYIRLSKEDENQGPSESVNNQKSLMEAFVQTHRLSVFATYVDDGVSGTTFDRPGFNRLVADIEAKKVNMVITKDLSRLGRDYIMTGHYMERFFPEHRVRYISLLDGIDTGVDSSANDITPFRAIMNDMYAKDISKKIKSVKHDKQRKGLFIGGKPMYGYRMHPTQKNQIVVDEGAAPVVRRIFAMALEGVSCRQIAAALNAEGVPTPATYAGIAIQHPGPYTGQWSSERISQMLQNETYLGNMVQGRTKKVSYKSRQCTKVAPEDWVVVEGTHEPLVAPEDFQRVRMLLHSRRHTRSRTYDFLLKGLIYCHECGHPMAVINRKKPSGEDCLYFVCRTYQRFTKAGACTCHSIREETVTKGVAALVESLCRQSIRPEALAPLARQALEAAGQPPREGETLGARVAALTAHLDQVYGDRLSGLLGEEDFARIYARLRAERAALEERCRRRDAQREAPPDLGRQARALAEDFLSTAGHNRELLVNLIERIELSQTKELYIRFRFPSAEAISWGPLLTLPQAIGIAD